MREDVQQKQPDRPQQADRPLSTATLAQADDKKPETRVQDRVHDRLERHGADPALREADRAPADGGPTLVPPGSRAGKAVQEASRPNPAGNREAIAEDDQVTPLFTEQASKDFFAKWDALQVGFIDEPRRSVEQADHLVAGAMKRLAEIFAEERSRLEGQWDRGDNVSTEDLRVAMRRYRSFFRRLLAV